MPCQKLPQSETLLLLKTVLYFNWDVTVSQIVIYDWNEYSPMVSIERMSKFSSGETIRKSGTFKFHFVSGKKYGIDILRQELFLTLESSGYTIPN